jgi:hypothetical protein
MAFQAIVSTTFKKATGSSDTRLFSHCFRLPHFPSSWKEANVTNLPKPGKDSKFPQSLRSISLLSTTGKLFENAILKTFQRHVEENNLLNACQFGFHVCHITMLQCMKVMEHVTLNFNYSMSTAVVFLATEKAFDTTWHPLLHCIFRPVHSSLLAHTFQQKSQCYE